MHAQTAMFESEKAVAGPAPRRRLRLRPSPPLISRSISNLWRALDVRALLLLSLLLQIALFVLGKRRKHSFSLINKIILWLAYQSKEWVIIAALGKLSSSQAAKLYNSQAANLYHPPETNSSSDDFYNYYNFYNSYIGSLSDLLTSLWGPLLILHLGGPDTITALTFQDTQLWTSHILTLVVQFCLAFSVIFLSLIRNLILIFTVPLYFVGVGTYIERILCLKLTKSKKTKQIISVFKNPDLLSHPLLENQESKIVLLAYALFSAMRPDVNDYLCHKEYPMSFKVRMRTYLKETHDQVKLILQHLLKGNERHFDVAVVELGFIFDVVYTKAAFIYTRKGFILRLISFTLSIGILFFFLPVSLGLIVELFPVDVCITTSLMVGVVALDICAVLSILCSDWAVILMYDNCLFRKILQYVFQCFPCLLRRQKRWSVSMGQFDLLDYCWNSMRTRDYRFLQKNNGGDILENYRRFKHTRFVEVPSCLKEKEVYQKRLDSFFSGDSFEATRGEKTLAELRQEISDIRPDLERSINVDFDASIIAWHLATSICYHRDCDHNNTPTEAMKSSKYLSDYMMYLLVIRPAMLLSDDFGSVWLDRALDEIRDELRDPISRAANKKAAFESLLLDLPEFSSQTAMENLPKYAGYLVTKLNQNRNKWELIKAMWIEMLLYAAHSSQHVNHVRHLGEYGQEFVSIIWVMGGYRIIQVITEEQPL